MHFVTDNAQPPETIPASWLDTCRTLTGLPLLEAFHRLDVELPPEAYKPISGGDGERAGLTDINPGFLPSVLLETFGPLGTGWGWKLLASPETQAFKTDKGKERYEARARLSVWYKYLAADGSVALAESPEVTGASDNSQIEWAEKGAVTNALGTAWFFLGYQVSVYQGRRSHRTHGVGVKRVTRPQVEAAMDKISEQAAARLISEPTGPKATGPAAGAPTSGATKEPISSPSVSGAEPSDGQSAPATDLVECWYWKVHSGSRKGHNLEAEWMSIGLESQATEAQRELLLELGKQRGYTKEEWAEKFAKLFNKDDIIELSAREADELAAKIRSAIKQFGNRQETVAAKGVRQERKLDRTGQEIGRYILDAAEEPLPEEPYRDTR